MDSLFFKCACCKKDIRMKKEIKEHFADWAYYYGVEWSDFEEDTPDFSDEDWNRSETTPIVEMDRTIHVWKPFDECIGNEFWVLFEPALCYFNGWDCVDESEIEKCAIIRCKLTKILKRNEYEAWVIVHVQEVVPISELYKYFSPHIAAIDLNVFDGIPEKIYQTICDMNKWLVTCWDAQGDCGEYKWIYIDENGTRHLVMQSWFDFDQGIVYLGNIMNMQSNLTE